MRLRRAVALAAVAVAATALAGCGGSDDEPVTDAATEALTVPPAETVTTETAQPTTIEVEVAAGKPVGGIARATVAQGSQVVIVVSSDDTSDDVHIEGYELSTPLEMRDSANLSFIADTPGRFEVELQSLGVPIAELTVE